ncbi:hypothetical protein FLX07_35750 [Microbispora bryophytorum]|nr:hypothetical protein FLX07_35750 [Microbispora bryophytorum]
MPPTGGLTGLGLGLGGPGLGGPGLGGPGLGGPGLGRLCGPAGLGIGGLTGLGRLCGLPDYRTYRTYRMGWVGLRRVDECGGGRFAVVWSRRAGRGGPGRRSGGPRRRWRWEWRPVHGVG